MNNLSARHFFQKLFSLKWECIGLACVVFLSIMIFRAASLTEVSVEISSSRKTSVEIFYLDTHISADNYSLKNWIAEVCHSPGKFAELHYLLPGDAKYRRLRFDFGNRGGVAFAIREIRIRRYFFLEYRIPAERIFQIFTQQKEMTSQSCAENAAEFTSGGTDCYFVSDPGAFAELAPPRVLWGRLAIVLLVDALVVFLLSVCIRCRGRVRQSAEKVTEHFEKHTLLWIIVSVVVAFAFLYREFIFGSAYYCYRDVGSDTIRSYLPSYRFLCENIRAGSLQMMLLQLGLGVSSYTLSMQMLDPFFLLLLFVPLSSFMGAMIWVAFAKYLVIAFFSWLYFKRFTHRSWLIWIGVLLWTFSSYNVLWGQHYQFLSAMVFFTINMYLLELLLAGRRGSFIFCVLNYALLSMFSVYFFSMIGIFSAVYLLGRSIISGFRWKKCLMDELQLLLNGLLGFMLSAWISLPWLFLFWGSGRSDAGSRTLANLFSISSFEDILIFLGRIVSNNYFGVLSHFVRHNYYETTILASSLLIFWAVSYYLFCRTKWQYWLIAGMMALPLAIPLFCQIFAYRWTFVLVFSAVVVIVSFLERYLKEPVADRQMNVFAVMFLIFIPVVLYAYFSVLSSVLFSVAVLSGVYLLFFSRPSGSRIRRFLPLLLMATVAVELFLMHNSTINQRIPLGEQDFLFQVFEGDIYRKVKPLAGKSITDGRTLFFPSADPTQHYTLPLIYNYPGVSAYNSLLPATIEKYSPETVDIQNSNRYSFYPEPATELLLGVTTQISIDSGARLFGYQKPEVRNGVWKFFRRSTLPFGYLYTQRITAGELKHYPKDELSRLRLSHFHFMDKADESMAESWFPGSLPKRAKAVQEAVPLMRDGKAVSAKGGEKMFRLVSRKLSASHSVSISSADPRSGFHILEIEGKFSRKQKIMLNCDGHMRMLQALPGHRTYRIPLPQEKVSEISFRVNPAVVKLISLSLLRRQGVDEEIDAAAAELKSSPVTDISYAHSTWRGRVDNRSGKIGMLCIPITWQEGWRATVSGRAEKVYGINNGLLGVPVPAGVHEVTVNWSPPYYGLGVVLSVSGGALTLLLYFFIYRKSSRKRIDEGTVL